MPVMKKEMYWEKFLNIQSYNNDNEPVLINGCVTSDDINLIVKNRSFKIVMFAGGDIDIDNELNYRKTMNHMKIVYILSTFYDVILISRSSFTDNSLDKLGFRYTYLPLFRNIPIVQNKVKGGYIIGYSTIVNGNYMYELDTLVKLKKMYGEKFILTTSNKEYNNNTNFCKENGIVYYSDMNELYKKGSILLRLTRHDGIANMVREFALYGVKSVYNDTRYKLSYKYNSIEDIIKHINIELQNTEIDTNLIIEQQKEIEYCRKCITNFHKIENSNSNVTFAIFFSSQDSQKIYSLDLLKRQTNNIIYIRDVYPGHAAMNNAFNKCNTKYMLQVDCDMEIHKLKGLVDYSVKLFNDDDKLIVIIHKITDPYIGVIQGIKIFNVDLIKSNNITYEDSKVCDRTFIKTIEDLGLKFFVSDNLHKSITHGMHRTKFDLSRRIIRSYTKIIDMNVLNVVKNNETKFLFRDINNAFKNNNKNDILDILIGCFLNFDNDNFKSVELLKNIYNKLHENINDIQFISNNNNINKTQTIINGQKFIYTLILNSDSIIHQLLFSEDIVSKIHIFIDNIIHGS